MATLEEEPALKLKKILIVDDESSLRFTLKVILEDAGYLVEAAYDLATIRKCLRNDHFDLIIMDIILRNASGLSYIQKIRTEFDYNGPIIVFTGEPNEEDHG